MRLCSLLTGKRKPRPGLGVAAFSPKQPAARQRRWRRAHFGTTGVKPVNLQLIYPFAKGAYCFFVLGGRCFVYWCSPFVSLFFPLFLFCTSIVNLSIQKVTPRRGVGQGVYFFSCALPEKGHKETAAPTTKRSNRTTNKTPRRRHLLPPGRFPAVIGLGIGRLAGHGTNPAPTPPLFRGQLLLLFLRQLFKGNPFFHQRDTPFGRCTLMILQKPEVVKGRGLRGRATAFKFPTKWRGRYQD